MSNRRARVMRIPEVLTRKEIKRVLAFVEGTAGLIVKLLYGSGLRITEAVRVQDQACRYLVKDLVTSRYQSLLVNATPILAPTVRRP